MHTEERQSNQSFERSVSFPSPKEMGEYMENLFTKVYEMHVKMYENVIDISITIYSADEASS